MRLNHPLLLLCLLLPGISIAQVSLRVFNYRPTGDFGFTMKPLVSAEISYQPKFDDSHWRLGFSLSYLSMKPRLDAFNTVGVEDDGGTVTILPGVQSYQNYNILQLASGVDVAFIHTDKLNIFGGIDFLFGAASIAYTNDVYRIIEESYSGGGYQYGVRGRLGAEYELSDHFNVFLTANRSYFTITEPRAKLNANDYGLGLRYSF